METAPSPPAPPDAARAGVDWSAAEAESRRALSARPDDPRLIHRLAATLLRQGRPCEAADLLARAVNFAPADPSHRIDLAAALGMTGRPREALDHLRVALMFTPTVPELHNNLGVTLEKLGRLKEAADAYRDALVIRDEYPEAHHNLGSVLKKTGRFAEAAASFQRALDLRPHYLKASQGLASTAGGLGDLARALAALRDVTRRAPGLAAARSAMLYTLHYSPGYDGQKLYAEHCQWGRLFCEPVRKARPPRHDNQPDPYRRLRVGYVSPDLRRHTVTKFITAAIQHHDREQFELFCYSDAEKPDEVTEKLKGMGEHWHETRTLKDEQLEELIRSHRIDMLMDLRGHAADNRLTLFARKPAPVQATMVGYFNTTGLSDHYRVTDELMDPPGRTEHLHTETPVRLPYSCWCYTPDEDAPEVAEPPALKNGCVTFGSLNKIVKVSEPCARLWARVLEAVPGSRLLLSCSTAALGCDRPEVDSSASGGT